MSVKIGSVVYCQDNEQVYVVLGKASSASLLLKNLTNLEVQRTVLPESAVIEYPDNWTNREWYEHLADYYRGK